MNSKTEPETARRRRPPARGPHGTARGPRFRIFKGGRGKWAWELQPAAGSAIAQSAFNFTRKRDAARSVRRTCQAVMGVAAGKLDLDAARAVSA